MINENLMLIQSLFPTPIYISKLERKLTKEELKIINKHKKKTYKNEGNTTSNNNYVLENKALKNLKKDLHKMVIDYFDKVICSDNALIPYITQSWINYTKVNQFHHRHSHANSYVSGVFYLNADKKVDHIKFYKPGDPIIRPYVTKYNLFNASTWVFPIETGNVILFPSSLQHGVAQKKGATTRISLSFNIFIKGKLGENFKLTELVLK